MGFFLDWLRPLAEKKRPPGKPPLASIEESFQESAYAYHFGFITDKGQEREYNEDSYYYWHSMIRRSHDYMPFGLYVVADGMGGHEGGENASELATQVVVRHALREIYLPFITQDADLSAKPINEVLVAAVESANRHVFEQLNGAGTTLTIVLLVENIAFFAHVGDSRAYLVKEDALKPMTQDHSLVNRLLEAGAISEEEATSHPQRNIIYRSIGQGQDLQTDWRTTDITPGSQILLCSDGLWGSVEDEDILATIKKAGNPQLACQQLVALAREQGSIDDITILLIPWDYERNGH